MFETFTKLVLGTFANVDDFGKEDNIYKLINGHVYCHDIANKGWALQPKGTDSCAKFETMGGSIDFAAHDNTSTATVAA